MVSSVLITDAIENLTGGLSSDDGRLVMDAYAFAREYASLNECASVNRFRTDAFHCFNAHHILSTSCFVKYSHSLAVRKTTAAVFHGRPDPLPDAVNSPQAAGNGRHRGSLPVLL